MRLLYLLLLCLPLRAATYYIDYAAGSDAAAGTSTGTAWKHCPFDPNATGTADALALTENTTFAFKGGVTYVGKLNCTNNPNGSLTFDGALWGTGKAILTLNNSATDRFCMIFDSVRATNVTIKNIYFKEIGGYTDADLAAWVAANPGVAIANNTGIAISTDVLGSVGMTIDGCDFSNIGIWQNTAPSSDSNAQGFGVYAMNAENMVVTNCTFTKVMAGVGLYAKGSTYKVSGVDVVGCDMHNYIRWGVDISHSSANATYENIRIWKNKIHDYTELDSVNWTGVGASPHTDGIFIRRVYTPVTMGRVDIYQNEFYNGTGATGGGTACIYLSLGTSANIYNNLFVNTLHARTIFLKSSSSGQTVNIWNNTFYNQGSKLSLQTDTTLATISVKNNIFKDPRTGFSFQINREDGDLTPLPKELDYNIYDTTYTYLATYQTLADLQAAGKETHGYQTASLLTDYGSGIDDYGNMDLAPATGSPVIGTGVVVTNFTADFIGTVRGETWDIGAYEFVEGHVAPTISSQPSSIYRQVGTPATFIISATGTAPLAYQWLKSASAITDATNSTYTISSCVLGDAGSYSCTVTNSYGSATSGAAVLTVDDLIPRGHISGS